MSRRVTLVAATPAGGEAQRRTSSLRKVWVAILGFILFIGAEPGARAGDIAYISTGTDQFGTIDLNTGAFTQIGNMGQLLSGLGVAGGNVYGGVNGGDTLYQVNPATGALTAIGTGSITYGGFGSTTSGLYALGPWTGSDFNLYSINQATGAATLIGPAGVSHDTISVGLSSGSGTLYFTDDNNLYSLNTTTGAASLIGDTGVSAFGAMVFESGVLYGGSYPSVQVYTLNTSTGATTLVTDTSGGISGGFWGLAPYPLTPSVPEPSSLFLLSTAIIGLGALVRRSS